MQWQVMVTVQQHVHSWVVCWYYHWHAFEAQ